MTSNRHMFFFLVGFEDDLKRMDVVEIIGRTSHETHQKTHQKKRAFKIEERGAAFLFFI